ncbi:SagB family peptide dehydrogenase [Nakamurella flavida]|uniref:SagB family peptide dehydrogenase n=1 Tax=Nakamurella flavida TaxID=363630 RepID=A0A939C295_9ACTN|nr:SagB family peptide dehydrogenase [Nakamurella flavida]MBM9476325.1 SagB family peptide dehydrogenase [Nakamurella flavida]MDP9779574.1 SagB-type dehydrogenase family enzyme [Nakamurella flavida]
MTSTLSRPAAPGAVDVPHARTVFRTGVDLVEEGGGAVRLDFLGREVLRFRGVTDSSQDRLRHMTIGGTPVTTPTPGERPGSDPQLAAILTRCRIFLAQAVVSGGQRLLEIERVGSDEPVQPTALRDEDEVQLSRLALAHRFRDEIAWQAPATGARAVIGHPAVSALLDRLARRRRVDDALDRGPAGSPGGPAVPEPTPAALRAVLELLTGAGIVERATTRPAGSAGPGGPALLPSESDPVLRQWELADLLFHTRSRLGRTDAPFGGRFPFVDVLDPQPTVKALPPGRRLDLTVPDFTEIADRDGSVLEVMEARRSVRGYGSAPMSLDALGEFLYRVARVRGSYGPRPTAGMPYAATSRPYPCGGGAYELEFYLTVRRCDGLETGCYYYDPAGHALIALDTPPAAQTALLDTASTSAGGTVVPDVLITLTSRFARVSWKYQAIAYAVTLKHVGVLYQSMYLVATAMGLAPCGLGSGDSQMAADAFGLDYLQESSVGDFLLGSLPDAAPAPSGVAPTDWRPGLSPDWPLAAARRLERRRDA